MALATTDPRAEAAYIQQRRALERAKEVKLGGCDVKREVARGELSMVQALTDPRSGHLTVYHLLIAQRRWGRERTVKTLTRLEIRERKRVRDLTDRQRQILADACR